MENMYNDWYHFGKICGEHFSTYYCESIINTSNEVNSNNEEKENTK